MTGAGFDIGFSGSSSASAANTAPFNFSGGGGKTSWLPWVVLGVIALFGLKFYFDKH